MFFVGQFISPLAVKFDFPRVKRLMVELLPLRRPRKLARVLDVMYETSVEIIKEKKKALESSDPAVVAEITNKKDIISILSEWHLKVSYFFYRHSDFDSES
jgi:hypothetical protein